MLGGSLLEVLPRAAPFCVQPMQRCPGGRADLLCTYDQREWFCPEGLDGAYDVSAARASIRTSACERNLALTPYYVLYLPPRECRVRPPSLQPANLRSVGLRDFLPLRGSRLAHQPQRPEGDMWERNWVALNITLGPGAHELTADLTPLAGVPPAWVRYAWGTQVGHGERLCCAEGTDPLVGRSKPCGSAACPIGASGGLPANPFLARIEHGRCRCIAPQECDEGADDERVV